MSSLWNHAQSKGISVKLLSISPFSPDAARTTPFVTTCGSMLPPTSTPIDKQIGESMNTFITNSAFVSTSSVSVTPGYSFSITSAKVQTNPATDEPLLDATSSVSVTPTGSSDPTVSNPDGLSPNDSRFDYTWILILLSAIITALILFCIIVFCVCVCR
ncbi:hypothetical protein GBAR_LOCUS23544 [Geodia barretti]|uniref:Uncharacterized protein n=1 Tax=Geodia barretti TaxID=519541 RepID=A0AA35X1Z7_GEOBA|nr:hypothetical protein GBAR_LOCUS23544 [Geodia barretti]